MRAFAIVAVVLVSAGCLEGAKSPSAPQTESVPLRSLIESHNQPIVDGKFEGTLDQAAWDAAWKKFEESGSASGSKPLVDFASERVIAVATGQFGSGCNAVHIDNASRSSDGGLVVRYSQFLGDGVCTAQVVWPTHVVAVKDLESVISFEKSGPPNAPDSPEPTQKRELDSGSFSSIGEDYSAVVRTQVEWDSLWARHTQNASRAQPAVEFPNESVIAVVVHGPTGCFGIRIGNITQDAASKRTLVEVIHIPTPANVRCIQTLYDAFDFVAIPTREGTVDFVDRHESPPLEAFEMRSIEEGSSSGIHEKKRQVVSDDASWQAFWAKHAPGREAPGVNFEVEQVFVAMLGDTPSGCWAVRVTDMQPGFASTQVEVTTYSPPIDAMCAAIVTQPYHFVSYPLGDASPLIREVSAQGPP